MACHSEGATRSKSKFLKPRRPKNLWFEPARKIGFDLIQQKKQPVALETKDSSSASHYLLFERKVHNSLSQRGEGQDGIPAFAEMMEKTLKPCYLLVWARHTRVVCLQVT
jgi:hypothetical protein